MFLVLLRVAIGWHLCYEGTIKLRSHWQGQRPFSSEAYLRAASGPFRETFRGMIEDYHGLTALDATETPAKWRQMIQRRDSAYGISDDDRAALERKLAELTVQLNEYLGSADNQKKILQYREQVKEWDEEDARPMPEFQRAEHAKTLAKLSASRKELTAPVASLTAELDVAIEATKPQSDPGWRGRLEYWREDNPPFRQADVIVMYGLTACGGLMMIGLFSRAAACGGAVLLLSFYLSNPPFPGLPPAPMSEGTYWIVNKNLIEAIACLALATTPSGTWAGLDALVRGLITRPLFGAGAEE